MWVNLYVVKILIIDMSDKKLITIENLLTWMEENGEDVLLDGPFDLTDKQKNEFLQKVLKNRKLIKLMISDGIMDEPSELKWDWLSVGDDNDVCDLILTEFVEFLNENKFVM